MTMTGRWWPVAFALTLLVVVLAAQPVVGQYSRPPRNTQAIRMKIEKSAELQRVALHLVEEPARAEAAAAEAYVQLRAAHGDMTVNAGSMNMPDPLFPLMDKRIWEARDHLLHARDYLKRAAQQGDRSLIGIGRERLQQSLRLTEIVLATAL
jgi:hypothetical protein